jgi:NADH:ubiquinone oxidoreductase subunit B-like Fe-S oxidoreductase
VFSEKYSTVQNLQNSNSTDAYIDSCIIKAETLLKLIKENKAEFGGEKQSVLSNS